MTKVGNRQLKVGDRLRSPEGMLVEVTDVRADGCIETTITALPQIGDVIVNKNNLSEVIGTIVKVDEEGNGHRIEIKPVNPLNPLPDGVWVGDVTDALFNLSLADRQAKFDLKHKPYEYDELASLGLGE